MTDSDWLKDEIIKTYDYFVGGELLDEWAREVLKIG